VATNFSALLEKLNVSQISAAYFLKGPGCRTWSLAKGRTHVEGVCQKRVLRGEDYRMRNLIQIRAFWDIAP
jgi:hypothetical protein